MEEKTPYYLWIDSVKGGSSAKGHEGWIPVWSYSSDSPDRSAGGGARSLKSISFDSPEDRSFYFLMQKMNLGVFFKSAKLDQVSRPKEPPTLFTMESIEIFVIQRVGDGFSFTLIGENLNKGAGYR